MGDLSELKRLATRIVEVQTSQDVPISKLFDDFDAATSPEVVLALIAENDRLESEAVYSAAGFDSAREEIARLRAEVAGLRTGYEAYEQVKAELKAEVEALVSAMNEIMRATPRGVEAFDIAALVLGELSGAALGQGDQS